VQLEAYYRSCNSKERAKVTQIIQLGQPPIEITVKRSARARRLSLRVSGVDGRVSLTVPNRSGLSEAEGFLRDKEPWIRKHLDKQPAASAVEPGAMIPVEGVERKIVETATRVVRLHPHWIEVPHGAEKTAPRVRAFLKNLARDRLSAASAHYAQMVGKPFGRITLRDTRSRWGSCTSDGNLMYSWRLVLAPSEVLDYVAAHEVSHLVEMNHSDAYWAVVAKVMPEYKRPRKWLRDNGGALHRVMF
jgi:predicted metal-dependent hydrolase